MRVFKLSIFITGIALFIFGCAGNSSGPNTAGNSANNSALSNAIAPANANSPQSAGDQLMAAMSLYKENCARCHQANGEGGKVSSDIGDFTVPSFKRPSVIKDPDSEYIETIEKGEEEMPSFKDKLSPDQIKDLVHFIRKEFQGQEFHGRPAK